MLDGCLELRQVDPSGTESESTLERGDFVYFTPRNYAHCLKNVSGSDARVVLVGNTLAQDVVELPDSGELYIKALSAVGSLIETEYMAGELA